MANSTLNKTITEIISSWPSPSWEITCINYMIAGNYSFDQGLRGSSGQPVSSLQDAWGVSVDECNKYCNQIPYSQIFSFQSFASSLTNYFLPWLALTAQLPFESRGRYGDMMSFCVAVGSPALVTFSLSLTLLNRRWVCQIFENLRVQYGRERGHRSELEGFKAKMEALQFLLQEGMQVPLRASHEGSFARLIAFPKQNAWLKRLQEQLQNTRRGITASLFAQMLLAVVAYLFVVIGSFGPNLANPEVALQISSGSLWIWLIPVVTGWITVGTQIRTHSIRDALMSDDPQPEQSTNQRSSHEANRGQDALYISGDSARADAGRVLTWKGFEVNGDERVLGPVFNYARAFTWAKLAKTITDSLRTVMWQPKDFHEYATEHRRDPDALETLMSYCGIEDPMPIYPVPAPDDSDLFFPQLQQRIFAASCMALFVQWGTTGSSIMAAYLTPKDGLGCRSGGYLIYGTLGTIVWIFLLLSMLASEQRMARDQSRVSRQLGVFATSPGPVASGRIFGGSNRHSGSSSRFPSGGPTASPAAVDASLRVSTGHPDRSSPASPTSSSTAIQGSALNQGTGLTAALGRSLSLPVRRFPDYSNQSSIGLHTLLPQSGALDGSPKHIGMRTAPSIGDQLLSAAAVCLRIAGKTLAVLNTLWLIASSLLEFLGLYDTCYCQSDRFSAHKSAWVVLFKGVNDPQIAATANTVGAAGLALSCGTCVVALFMLYVTSVKSPWRER